MTEYVNAREYVTIKCVQNHVFTSLPTNIMSNATWCQVCSGCSSEQARMKFEQLIIKNLGKLHGSYRTAHDKILIECQFNHLWKANPHNIKRGRWCLVCNESALEREARLFLEQNNIPYEREYKISGVPRKRYDFYFTYNNHRILLELDGQQHFEYNQFFHRSTEKYQFKQNIDRLKTQAAINFGYYLIRIDYTQLHNIKQHLVYALTRCGQLYFSSYIMYTYLSQLIPNNIIIEHSKFLAIKLGFIIKTPNFTLEIIG